MENQFNEALISSVKDRVPKGKVVDMLMETLCIGKEAAYRRMRGEVLFTFDEVAKISLKLRMSMDDIIGIKHEEKAVFDLRIFESGSIKNFMESYSKIIQEYIEIFTMMSNVSDSKTILAFNTLPYVLCTPHITILKFRIYKWMHQSMGFKAPVSLSEVDFPKELLKLQETYILNSQKIKSTHAILDKNAFISFILDVKYFYRLNLINEEEMHRIKEELLDMLSRTEHIAQVGANENGNEVLIYISNVNFEACYGFYEWKDFRLSHMRVYSINGISSRDSVICKGQKEWLESLKRYSVLISRSGEIQRIEFFKEQQDFLRACLNFIAIIFYCCF
jgi:hypothetical protein